MSLASRRLLISMLVLLAVFCICTLALAVGGILTWFAGQITNSSNLQPTLVVEIATEFPTPRLPTLTPSLPAQIATSEPAATHTASPPPLTTAEIPSEILQQMESIQDQVIELRGLQSDNSHFQRTVLSSNQLRERVINDFFKDYTPEELQIDQTVLSVFGLLEPDFDLMQMYSDLYSEQIAGFYDNETKEMVIVQGQDFSGVERDTYAHEYMHALQDQNYNIKDGLQYDSELCESAGERCAAILALLEGDASLVEEDWLFNFSTLQDKQDLIEFYSTYESPVFDRAPAFLQDDFLFPYLQGKQFVAAFQSQSGWSGLKKLYADPPITTEQILHPERYPQDVPLPVQLDGLEHALGPDWVAIDNDVLGEWYTYLVLARGQSLQSRVDDGLATSAAEGWGGDNYLVYQNPHTGGVVLVLKTVWDSPQDAKEFAEAFVTYADGRFGKGNLESTTSWSWENRASNSLFTLSEQQSETMWVLSPDSITSQAVQAAISQP